MQAWRCCCARHFKLKVLWWKSVHATLCRSIVWSCLSNFPSRGPICCLEQSIWIDRLCRQTALECQYLPDTGIVAFGVIVHCTRVLILSNLQSFIRIMLSQVHHPNYNTINHLIIDNRNYPMRVIQHNIQHSQLPYSYRYTLAEYLVLFRLPSGYISQHLH